MIAPAANRVAQDLGATTHEFEPLLTSIFILAYGWQPYHLFVMSLTFF